MEPLELFRSTPDLNSQLSFLIDREIYVTYYKYRRLPYLFVGILLLLGIMFLFPENQTTVTIIELIISVLLIFCLVGVFLVIKYLWIKGKRERWKVRTIRKYTEDNKPYKLSFDEDTLFYEDDRFKTELKWEYFKYWTEQNNSIFIFPAHSLYEATYLSQRELGEKNYNDLKEILTSKLLPLTYNKS